METFFTPNSRVWTTRLPSSVAVLALFFNHINVGTAAAEFIILDTASSIRLSNFKSKSQAMYNSNALLDVLLVVCLCQWCICAPTSFENHRKLANRETKKDIFISRGWGAGGMPFSVLYMNPTFSSSKAPATVESNFRPQPAKSQRKSLPQVRNSMRQKTRTHSIIPQLFVSYGWGPLGKK